MIEIASEYAKNNFPKIKNIGLLASNGTIKTEIYHNAFREKKISIIVPIEEDQKKVVKAIDLVKSGTDTEEAKEMMSDVIKGLVDRGADSILAGCTEIPVVLDSLELNVQYFDATLILAKYSVLKASNRI